MSRSDDILVVEGNLQCGAGCTFQRRSWCGRTRGLATAANCRPSPSMAMRSSETSSDNTLVDSRGIMEIGAGSIVRARATAGQAIFLGAGAQVGSAFAPVVTTLQKEPESPDSASAPTLEITLPDRTLRKWPIASSSISVWNAGNCLCSIKSAGCMPAISALPRHCVWPGN